MPELREKEKDFFPFSPSNDFVELVVQTGFSTEFGVTSLPKKKITRRGGGGGGGGNARDGILRRDRRVRARARPLGEEEEEEEEEESDDDATAPTDCPKRETID